MTTIQQQKAAREFAERWAGKGYEKGESQKFWTTLLSEIFGIQHVDDFIIFEDQVQLGHTSFIDARIPSTKVMIEQKSLGKNLGEGIKQSDGSILNPFQQAKQQRLSQLSEEKIARIIRIALPLYISLSQLLQTMRK